MLFLKVVGRWQEGKYLTPPPPWRDYETDVELCQNTEAKLELLKITTVQ
jgi:hypothetical protein